MNVDDHPGLLESLDRLVNRGGEADGSRRGVLQACDERGFAYAGIRFVEDGELVDGPSVGERGETWSTAVVFEGRPVGELVLSQDTPELAQRIATLISAYVLVGWDTGGERWEPQSSYGTGGAVPTRRPQTSGLRSLALPLTPCTRKQPILLSLK